MTRGSRGEAENTGGALRILWVVTSPSLVVAPQLRGLGDGSGCR